MLRSSLCKIIELEFKKNLDLKVKVGDGFGLSRADSDLTPILGSKIKQKTYKVLEYIKKKIVIQTVAQQNF